MREAKVEIVCTLGDLAGRELGTRIATNHNKLLVLDVGYGSEYWFEDGELTPYSPIHEWLPVVVLPPVVREENEDG